MNIMYFAKMSSRFDYLQTPSPM